MSLTLGAALALGGASALGNIVGGALGANAQASANAANLQIARETNEQQYKMFQEQMGYNTAERIAAQEYNSPNNQRKLYEQAGINPYSVTGNMNSQTVAQSAPSAPAQHVAQVAPNTAFADMARNLGSTVGNTLSDALQADALNLDNQSKRIDLQYKTQEKLLAIDEKMADIAHKKNLTEQDRVQLSIMQNQRDELAENLDLLRSNKSEYKKQVKLQTHAARLENKAKALQNEYQDWCNDFAKKKGAKELEQLNAAIAAEWSQVSLNGALSAQAKANAVLSAAEKSGVDLDNQQKKMLRGHVLKMAQLQEQGKQLENNLTRYNTGINTKDWFNNINNLLTPIAIFAATRGLSKGAKPINGFR